mgnify:CR=1 FL=1
MNRKDIITFTVECSLASFSSFIDMLENHQNKNNLYERKSIRTTNRQGNLVRNRCVVCLFGVTDSFTVMGYIARQLKAVNTIHSSPIFLKAFSVINQEQHS